MSKFKTSIPVDVEAIKNGLPARSFVHGVAFDGQSVTVEWENDHFKTPYTFSVDWPDLNKVPAGVRDITPGAPCEPAKKAPDVTRQQMLSPSQIKGKADDAAAVKKKATK